MREKAAKLEFFVETSVCHTSYPRPMDIFLNDKSSLQLIRCVYRNEALALVPCDVKRPRRPMSGTIKLDRLQIPGLLGLLHVPEEKTLGLLVPTARERTTCSGIECKVNKNPRGKTPFLLLTSSDPNNPNPLVPTNHRVFVLAPEGIVLAMAYRLGKTKEKGSAVHQRSVLMLVKLILELCGTFSHDPLNPNGGDVVYETKPHMTVEGLRSYLALPGNEHGLPLAREAAALAYDKSGSPQESFMGPALFYPESLGGLALCDFVANEELDLSPDEWRSIGHRTITPDFQLVGYQSVVEYLGAVHEEGSNPTKDHRRSLDYQTLGKREFNFVYDDVCTRMRFMASAVRLATVIEQYDGSGAVKRVLNLSRNKSFIERQRTLFEVFRPWLR